ncbi:hypothetical protein NC652_010422 [Populus alba x Populus x berolinensis]|nr:hypothetical protein NC652_010422 [Populus alba x Populus x berolinensis]
MVKLSSGEASRWDLAVDLRRSMGGGRGPWSYRGYLCNYKDMGKWRNGRWSLFRIAVKVKTGFSG